MTDQLVVLKLFGSPEQGVQVALELGPDGAAPSLEMTGSLPSAPELVSCLQAWQRSYRRLQVSPRIRPKEIVHGGSIQPIEDCQRLGQQLQAQFQAWLNHSAFRSLDQRLREALSREDCVRVLIRTDDWVLQQLPWHTWSLIDRYHRAEVSLSAPLSQRLARSPRPSSKTVKILAILGDSSGIDVAADRRLLAALPQAEVTFLVEPQRDVLNQQLWTQPWDILFFAGHSASQAGPAASQAPQGRLFINPNDSLAIAQLNYGFRQAIANGLQIAIFNSCDGLGLATDLNPLGLPHLILMREPVPDRVAQVFLQHFLSAYATGIPLHLAVRQARERLQGQENIYPCASWLPILAHTALTPPPTWPQLTAVPAAPPPVIAPRFRFPRLTAGLTAALIVSLTRWTGLLQSLELQAYDWLMTQRPTQAIPPRVLLVEATEADVETYGYPLPDETVAAALERLAVLNPRIVGLDLFRDQPNAELQAQLAREHVVALCSPGQPDYLNRPGIAPPPGMPEERIGFSTVMVDPDGVVRRQLMFLQPDTPSPCATRFSLATLLALHYLESEGIVPENLDRQRLRLGEATFTPLEADIGPYRGADSRGFQVFLNYAPEEAPKEAPKEAPEEAPEEAPKETDRLTLSALLDEQTELPDLSQKAVLIGMTAPISNPTDYFLTPAGARQWPRKTISGVQIHAHMVNALLAAALDGRRPIWALPEPLAYGWIWLWAIAGSLGPLARPYWKLWLGGLGLYALCWLALWGGFWLPLVPSVLALAGSSWGAQWLLKRQR